MRREGGEHVLREVERGEGEHVRAQPREVEDLVRLALGQAGRVGRVLVEPPLQAVHEPQVEGVELLAEVWRARDALEVEAAQPLNLDLRESPREGRVRGEQPGPGSRSRKWLGRV